MTPESLAASMVADISASGGSSRSYTDGSSPTSGFMVSIPGCEQTISMSSDQDELSQSLVNFITSYGDTAQSMNGYIGAWEDEGQIYLDVSQQFDNLDSAIAVGKASNQIAIFDVVGGDSIYMANV